MAGKGASSRVRGWYVLRFWNNEFRINDEAVLQSIFEHLVARAPSPWPSSKGRGPG
ncbi:DUF559 domain-containing protein [[Enterobacter] lignolyticus]|uniref:DUF559 domain-containing protein n=1 Tax=[Enterobacter] lignolyticus TaxID=1334193 RepID=UPI003AAEED96